MTLIQVNEKLKTIQEGNIESIDYSFLKTRLSIIVVTVSGKCKININGVKYISWYGSDVNAISEFHGYEDDDYLELTSIVVYTDDIGKTINKSFSNTAKWIESYGSKINVGIEVWNGAILLNAKTIEIDNEIFDLY